MKTIGEILKLSTEFLQKKGITNARRQTEELIALALGIKRLDLYMQHDRPLQQKELDLCRSYLQRRSQGEPLSYIYGSVEFYHCTFNVNRSVLIPRQETEILVDKIAGTLSKLDLKGKTLWDLCCGSGCIGIALKKRFPELSVVLSEISDEALTVAQTNATQNEIDVTFLKGDLFKPFQNQTADFIVCNPPYISEDEYYKIEKEVASYEPRMALVSGKTGLEFYERLSNELYFFLNPGGHAWFEIGTGQGKPITEIFKKHPWKRCHFESDWSGHNRFFFLDKE